MSRRGGGRGEGMIGGEQEEEVAGGWGEEFRASGQGWKKEEWRKRKDAAA